MAVETGIHDNQFDPEAVDWDAVIANLQAEIQMYDDMITEVGEVQWIVDQKAVAQQRLTNCQAFQVTYG